MESVEFQKRLFRAAMCVMACDGEIHEGEVREMELAFEQTDFFRDLVFKDELESIVRKFETDEKQVVIEYFEQIKSKDLNPVQQLQILEIILRIIYADKRVDDNEIEFLKIVKSRLGVPNEIFYKRFGKIDWFGGEHYQDKEILSVTDFMDHMVLPDIQELTTIFDGAKVADINEQT